MSDQDTFPVTLNLSKNDLGVLQSVSSNKQNQRVDSCINGKEIFLYPLGGHYFLKLQNIVLAIVDAAIAQGHIQENDQSLPYRFWENLKLLQKASDARARNITAKFRDCEIGNISKDDLFEYADNHPCPLLLYSQKLKEKGYDIWFKIVEHSNEPEILLDGEPIGYNWWDSVDCEVLVEVSDEILLDTALIGWSPTPPIEWSLI